MKASAFVWGALILASCATPPAPVSPSRPPAGIRPPPSEPPPGATPRSWWECAPYARERSGVQIYGDAWTWWTQAEHRYGRGVVPQSGAVLVFQPFAGSKLGHVAVVSEVLTDRIVQVDHANWGGSRGKIEQGVTMVDVSPAGDWSRVKVWYNPAGDLGGTIYPTYGFIYPAPQRTAATGTPHAEDSSGGPSQPGGRRSDP